MVLGDHCEKILQPPGERDPQVENPMLQPLININVLVLLERFSSVWFFFCRSVSALSKSVMYLPSALIPPAHPGEMLHSWPLSLHFCSAEDKELPIRGCWASASQGFQPTSAAGCVKDSLGLSVGVRASLWVTGCLDVHFSSLLPHTALSDPTSFHTHRQRTRDFLLPHHHQRFQLPLQCMWPSVCRCWS